MSVFDNALKAVGRTSVLRAEIKRLLAADLPVKIDEKNAETTLWGGRTGTLPQPQGFINFGERVHTKHPYFCCRTSDMQTEAYGAIGGVQASLRILRVTVALISGPKDSSTHLDDIADVVSLASALLVSHTGSHCDPNGIRVWSQIEFAGDDVLDPELWPDLSGHQAVFKVWQPPGLPYWG